MQKNNFVLMLMLGLIFSPFASIHAENTSVSANTSVKADVNAEVRADTMKDIINKTKTERDTLRADAKAQIEDMKKAQADFKASINARRAEFAKELSGQKFGLKIKLGTAAKARVKKNLDAIFANMNKKIDNLTQLEAKLSAKIGALKNNEGKNTAAAEAQLVVAQNALAKAKIDIEAAKALANTQADAQTSKEELRSLILKARESIRTAASEYWKVVSILMNGKIEARTNTTVESSASTAIVNQ